MYNLRHIPFDSKLRSYITFIDTLTTALAYGIFALKVAPVKLKSSARELFEDFFFKDRSSDYEVLIITKESKEDWVS